ncbi:MAG: hypothetical protein WBH76_06560 [Dictyoglomaceae bacterium]|nr:hypothetical protein [Dictyoglomaceae bacterium]HPU44086.1 hypothetical protein [Dictyoglomaceae bacterium]
MLESVKLFKKWNILYKSHLKNALNKDPDVNDPYFKKIKLSFK